MHAAPATAHLKLVLQLIVGCVGLHQGRWSVARAMASQRLICKQVVGPGIGWSYLMLAPQKELLPFQVKHSYQRGEGQFILFVPL